MTALLAAAEDTRGVANRGPHTILLAGQDGRCHRENRLETVQNAFSHQRIRGDKVCQGSPRAPPVALPAEPRAGQILLCGEAF